MSAAGRVQFLTAERRTQRTAGTWKDPAIAARFETMREGRIKRRFVVELAEGRWWGRAYGHVIDTNDALHHDLSPAFGSDDRPGRHDALLQLRLPRAKRLRGNVAVIATPFCQNFHHWLLDTLPKWRLLQEAGWSGDQLDAVLLLPGTDQPWHRQALAKLGIPDAKVIRGGPRDHYRADRLIVPAYAEPGCEPERFDYTPEGLQFVRELFFRSAALQRTWPRRIVVSRELAAERRWAAGAAGHQRLAREGFVKVCLEQLSLDEQAALFAHADRIVMPTGGGLANLAFCQPGTRVVELFCPAYIPMFSAVLAGPLGLDYRAVVGSSLSGASGHRHDGGRQDIDVTVESVLEQCA